ncbi:SMP-30/gluconolactonase/LRE family protein [bacterium]|nr:SMP-30/gluconolactonase/LRE family protein [bacterium]
MRIQLTLLSIAAIVTMLLVAVIAFAEPTDGEPLATIDLATAEGVQLVNAQWRYSDTKIVEVDFKAAGADGQPTGAPNKTYDYVPHAGGADFDDSRWEVLDPATLNKRRGNGRISFNWYRINITIPDRVGNWNTAGSTVVFETSLDDYAEIWVNGELPRELGQSGGSVVGGWNATNRLVIGRNVKPQQKIQLAIFGINGPISNPPTNYIWMRFAKLHFFPTGKLPFVVTPHEVNVEVERLDPAIDAIVPPNPKVHKLAEGFQFTEGPVWFREGYLLFSDPNSNIIYKYVPSANRNNGELTVFNDKSGYEGADIAAYGQPGSNGLTIDSEGRLTIDQHGNRRVIRMEKNGAVTVLAEKFKGKRLNSPNDLVYKSDGSLYFTDPPFGLPKFYEDPKKELEYSGVFRLKNGKLQLLNKDLLGPNGIAFSPDEKYLYVGNWDPKKKVVMRYEVSPDGMLKDGKVFYDLTNSPGEDAIDGVKVDQMGNVYVSGPGGLWIFSSEGKHLGTIKTSMHPHNFAWGEEDGKTLYLCARSGLYRMKLNIPGVRP